MAAKALKGRAAEYIDWCGPQSTDYGPLQHVVRVARFPSKSESQFDRFSGQHPLESCPGNPEASSRFAHRQPPDSRYLLDRNLTLGPTELPALRLCPREPRNHALPDTAANTNEALTATPTDALPVAKTVYGPTEQSRATCPVNQ
jgi:hypothetical protein